VQNGVSSVRTKIILQLSDRALLRFDDCMQVGGHERKCIKAHSLFLPEPGQRVQDDFGVSRIRKQFFPAALGSCYEIEMGWIMLRVECHLLISACQPCFLCKGITERNCLPMNTKRKNAVAVSTMAAPEAMLR
jgi:hypothetical protein